jgi:hypothetical protein
MRAGSGSPGPDRCEPGSRAVRPVHWNPPPIHRNTPPMPRIRWEARDASPADRSMGEFDMGTRRDFIALLLGGALAPLAVRFPGETGFRGRGDSGRGRSDLPLAGTNYVLPHRVEELRRFMMSGGPPPDGIPAIDDPRFLEAGEARLDPADIVIGFEHGGEARAYPQHIMVWHEVVNDRVGGLNVAVTYCPLTATAQAFRRGRTTLGVSGQLLNSNMVLFDRSTDSYFSQIAGVGLTGEHRGRTLDEVNATWTTWERWRAAFPGTTVLSERTGHLRNYARDPYGSYNPPGGYYVEPGTIFPLMRRSDRHPDKEMVVGARTSEGSVYFVLADLARDAVQRTESFIAVHDPALDTGHVYRKPAGEDPPLSAGDGGLYELDGQVYGADGLPLEKVVAVEGFFFAWYAFYPDSEHVGSA